MYTQQQLERLKVILREYLYYFRYTDDQNGQADPRTIFFTFDGETEHDDAKLLALYAGFKRCNEDTLRWATSGQANTGEFEFNKTFHVDNSTPTHGGVIYKKLTIKEL